jgi:iron uptake system component EfeO
MDGPVAAQLGSDVAKLVDQTRRVDLSPAEIGSAALTLMKSVASSKITGEEERYSGLDLVDVAASVDGSQMAYSALRSIVYATNANLVFKLDARYATLNEDLAPYRRGDSFVLYDDLSKAEVDALHDDVSALIGPLGQLSAAAQKE